MSREEVIKVIEGIYSNEKFKQDAFFFCGFPSDRPNEKIIKACADYLDGKEGAKENLVSVFSEALNAKPEVDGVKNILANRDDLQWVIDNVDLV